jgi:hypothetical protein
MFAISFTPEAIGDLLSYSKRADSESWTALTRA